MKRRLPPRLLLAFVVVLVVLTGIILSTIKTNYSIEGARILPLIGRCELWILEEPLQPEQTIALAVKYLFMPYFLGMISVVEKP